MSPAFILRFQETCLPDQSATVPTGTVSVTAVRAEATDADVERSVFAALPIKAGTDTMTRTPREHTDADHDLWSANVLPSEKRDIFLMTQTFTKVRAESVDAEPDGRRLHAIP